MRRQFLLLLFALLAITTAATAQNRRISGVVTDDKGDALSAVSIKVKGVDVGVTTDAEGKYAIDVAGGNKILVVSYVGYVTREMPIGDNTSINIALEQQGASLDQVVVTGYSSQRKKDITGSVSVVDMSAMKSVANGSALQALQGQASGVNIIRSGAPGGSSNVFVRGISSFGNTAPLVLIDGVEGSLDNIPANEIQSIQVLKDAGAAAIYGVRGSNGVIVVTTKKGKSGVPVVTFSTYYGVQKPLSGNVFNLMNSEQIAAATKAVNPATALFQNGLPDYMYRGGGAAGVAMEGDPAVDPSKYNLDPKNSANNYLIQKVNKEGTDWFHELFETAPIQDHNVSVSGGGNKSAYMLSLGYFDQQGTMLETYMKRYSARMNSSFTIGKNIRIGENVSLIYKNYRDPVGTPISWAYRQMPVIPVYDIMGNFGGTFAGQELGASSSPVQVQRGSQNNSNQLWTAVGNIYAEVDFLKNFTVRTSIGGRIQNIHNTAFTFTPYNNTEGNNNPNSFREGSSYGSNTTWTNTLKYLNKFGNHNVEVIVGTEAIRNYGRAVSGTRQGYFSTDVDYLTLANGTLNVTNTSSAYVNTLFSMFGRVDYSLKSKYLLGATIRRDGSSKFGSNNRYGVFPSVSVGWRVSDEEFMKNISWISDMKLRASYGVLGSQNTVSAENAYNLFGGTFSNAYYDINGTSNSIVQGFFQTIMGNSSTGWEEDIITNYGVDLGMLNNRISLSVEYYKKSINGLLFPKDLPATVGGATVPTVNVGDIQNKGWDISLGYRENLSTDFGFRASANITT